MHISSPFYLITDLNNNGIKCNYIMYCWTDNSEMWCVLAHDSTGSKAVLS